MALRYGTRSQGISQFYLQTCFNSVFEQKLPENAKTLRNKELFDSILRL